MKCYASRTYCCNRSRARAENKEIKKLKPDIVSNKVAILFIFFYYMKILRSRHIRVIETRLSLMGEKCYWMYKV